MINPNEEPNVNESEIKEMERAADELRDLAHELGLEPNSVNYWLVDHDDINVLSAYQGFQTRYPHWRWGMKYSERKKKDTFFGGKIFELVNHDEPSNAFLQESNSMQEQKSVIAHVEAHADFFANNEFFDNDPDAANMLERHAEIIESYYNDPSIEYSEVEEWIDAILCLENTIDPLRSIEVDFNNENINSDNDEITLEDKVESLDLSEEVKRQVFDDIDEDEDNEDVESDSDVLAYLLNHGMQYDEDSERAKEYEDWQRTILEILRKEAYYFAAQKMTKIMNEGWASFWESIMMMSEGYADFDEVISYADKQSRVLKPGGMNPYYIGNKMWQYIENKSNRREVVDKLLRVDGITWRNFHSEINFSEVNDTLEYIRDDDNKFEKHYSLLRPENRGFIQNISKDELQKQSRYMFDDGIYDNITEALEDVDMEVGWNKMREVRETHNDITFIDTFLTEEFVNDEEYFSYEYNPQTNQNEVSSTSLEDVKKKLLLQITNGGKPTIVASDNNFNNSGELLLKHKYNGIPLDLDQANKVLERTFELWGKPVNLKTIDKDAEGNETGKIIRYNGEKINSREIKAYDDIKADEIDYDTKPDEWL